MFTDNTAVVLHLNSSGSFGSVGGEYAVIVDGTHLIICQTPLNVIGDIDLGTDSVGAESVELNGAAGSVVFIICGDARARKYAVIGCGGNNQNGVGGRSLTAVSHTAVDLQLFAGTLGAEGGGAAAVTVCRINAAELEHVVCHLVLGEAGRERSHLAVIYGYDHRTVRLDADKGSRCTAAVVLTRILLGGNALRVRLNEPSPNRDRVLFPTGKRLRNASHLDLRHIVRTLLSGVGINVIVDNKRCILSIHTAERSAAVLIVIAVADVPAERFADILGMLLIPSLGIPAEHRVGCYNNVAVAQFLCVFCLIRGRLGTEMSDRRIHILISGDDLDIRIVEINRRRMQNLSACTGSVVQHDLGLVDTGRDVPFSLRNQIVIGTTHACVIGDAPGRRADGEYAGSKHQHKDQG